jgi:intergrase/recombinase
MNIFILSDDPVVAAKEHVDKHVVKMILESAQLLSTAHRVLDNNPNPQLYQKTHINHPCSIWVRQSSENYRWLYNLFVELCKEYTFRYHKTHLCETKLGKILAELPKNISYGKMTPFAQAMPEKYRHKDAIRAYQQYYMGEKRNFAKWTKRPRPQWFI